MAETAIGWVLSPIIKKIVEKTLSCIKSQYNWQEDIQKNLKKLANILTEIQTVVAKAEHLQSMDATQEPMLRLLKDAIYDAEDLLDEFEYHIKEAQAMEGGGTVNHKVSSSLRFAKRLIGQDKLANRLKEILNELYDVRKTAGTFNCQVVAASQQPNMHDRVTSSFPPSKHFGRAEEKEKVINLLLKKVDEPESSHTNVPVIAIVGNGGIGKTTLAQIVYDDQRIKDQFDRMWISVPGNFDEISLTKEILECAYASSGRNKDVMNFNQVMNFNCLQEQLQTEVQQLKRFLLVLDNVWIQKDKPGSNVEFVNQQLWDTLLAPLQQCKKGSKILVTTRMKIVASVIGATPFSLKGLSDNETWLLLKEYAFSNEIPHNSSELEEIGQLIIKRLNGSPLAAKALAPMLKVKPDARSWLQILEKSIFNNDNSIRSILRLSYQRLPNHLKYCFAYCSIFPKNWTFEPEKLALLWIAQGYVDGTEKPLRDIGIDYFNQLLSRSLFEKVEQHYVMHEFIHDLAEDVSKDECFRIDGVKKGTILKTVRHLGIVADCVDEPQDIIAQLKSMSNLKNLRTLMFFGYARFDGGDLLSGILQELKNLRVLDFGISAAWQFPQTLCHYLHLRYLNLGQWFSGILPESLSRLYHLQVLSAGELPLSESMFRLLKFGELKFLAVKKLKFNVERKECHKFGESEFLAAIILISKLKRKECHRIGVLKDMGMETVLGGNLCILNLEDVTDKAEAAEADLGSMQYLDGLELHWDSFLARINGHDADQEVAEVLKPHPNLRRVTVEGFRGSRCPSWLESKWLDSLQSLSLIDCSELVVLPPLDHLPLLKKCTVKKCPKLMSFPRFPPMLWEIEIRQTGLISELSLWPSLLSPERFDLSTNGISSHTALLHDHHLRAIQQLRLSDCQEPLPGKWLLRLTALKKLEISDCEELLMSKEEEDGGGILPSSLESLEISDSPVTENWLSRCLQGLTSLKELTLLWYPELKSLRQEDDGGILATSLKSLEICACPVTDLSLISRCTSLKKLRIRNCPGLKSSSKEEDGGSVLPSSLESLDISDCPVTDLSLINHCTSIKYLRIQHCFELKSLPEEGLPTSLEEVYFVGCGVPKKSVVRCLQGLPSLSKLTVDFQIDLTALTSLRHLTVKSCRCDPRVVVCSLRLESFVESPTSLSDWDSWDSWVVRTSEVELLTSLSELSISTCDTPTYLHQLTALQKLHISYCDELQSKLRRLEDRFNLKIKYDELTSLRNLHASLPSSIKYLYLYNYPPALEQQIREKAGPHWCMLAHIPYIYIK